jgi:ribosomal protein S18 acetylase RimI-like enzyme
MRFVTLTDDDLDKAVGTVGPWLHEAGNPYFDWLLGGRAAALPILTARMRAADSEISLRDVAVLLDDAGRVVGGFVAHDGGELQRRRRADAVAFLHHVRAEECAALVQRMKLSRGLFTEVEPQAFYLSKVGIRPDARRRGYGRVLTERFLAEGATRGASRFLLDVGAANHGARRLYESLGFELTKVSHGGGMTYLAMQWNRPRSTR